MSPLMFHRCALALFFAMLLASGCGLIALEPIEQRISSPLSETVWSIRLAQMLLIGTAAWTARLLYAAGAAAATRPWAWSALAFAAPALLQAIYLPTQSALRDACVQAFLGAACVLLLCGFFGERFGRRRGVGVGLVAAVIGPALALGWWVRFHDLRPLIWLQLAPLWLLPSGLLRMPGDFTRPRDWWWLLLGYVCARFGEYAPQLVPGMPGGPIALHVGLASMIGWLGYRVWASHSSSSAMGLPATEGTNQRTTSLNTSS